MSLQDWMTSICAGFLGLMSLAAQAQTVRYIHTDALGSPVAVTNASRTLIERSEYEPYGQVVNRPVKAGPGYTGHVMDVSTGLAYMQQRYYDPMLGRFLSADPVTANGNTGGNFNRYWYANNNPYKFIDPDGRQACGELNNCIEATNVTESNSDGATAVQSADVDIAARALPHLPGFETTGNQESGVRFDESSSGLVRTTPVETQTVVDGSVLRSTMTGLAGAESLGHSHPTDTSDPSPGPGDDDAPNSRAAWPLNVVHKGNVIVIEKVNGQFRTRVLTDSNLTSGDKREIQRDMNEFQSRGD